MAENFIGQLKKKIYIQLRLHKTENWVSLLPIVTKNLNGSPHPSLGGLIPANLTSKVKAVAVDEARGIPREPSAAEIEANHAYFKKHSTLQPGMYCYVARKDNVRGFDVQVSPYSE